MGPLTQIIFVYILSFYIDNSNLVLFNYYNRLILLFNMLPIYPLDGGKLLNIVINYFISFYKSYQITLYISYFLFISCFIVILIYYFNSLLFIIFLLLGIMLIKEFKKAPFYYQRFLLERYINNYFFSRIKNIKSIENMKRDNYHFIRGISEKEYLRIYFNSK